MVSPTDPKTVNGSSPASVGSSGKEEIQSKKSSRAEEIKNILMKNLKPLTHGERNLVSQNPNLFGDAREALAEVLLELDPEFYNEVLATKESRETYEVLIHLLNKLDNPEVHLEREAYENLLKELDPKLYKEYLEEKRSTPGKDIPDLTEQELLFLLKSLGADETHTIEGYNKIELEAAYATKAHKMDFQEYDLPKRKTRKEGANLRREGKIEKVDEQEVSRPGRKIHFKEELIQGPSSQSKTQGIESILKKDRLESAHKIERAVDGIFGRAKKTIASILPKDLQSSVAFKLWRTITLPFNVKFSMENQRIYIKEINPDLISKLPMFMLKKVKPDQLKAMFPEHLDELSDEQFKYLVEEDLLTPELIETFRERDIVLSLDLEEFKHLDPKKLATLSAKQTLLLDSEQKAHLHGSILHKGVELKLPENLNEFSSGSEFVLNDRVKIAAGGKERLWVPQFIARTIYDEIENAAATNQLVKQMGRHLFADIEKHFAVADQLADEQGTGIVGAGPHQIRYALSVKGDQVVLEAKLIRPIKNIGSDEPEGYQEATVTLTSTISGLEKGDEPRFHGHINVPQFFKDDAIYREKTLGQTMKTNLSSIGRKVGHILPENMRFLTKNQIQSLTTEQLSLLTLEQVKELTPDQIDQFTNTQQAQLRVQPAMHMLYTYLLHSPKMTPFVDEAPIKVGESEIRVNEAFKRDVNREFRVIVNNDVHIVNNNTNYDYKSLVEQLYKVMGNVQAVEQAQKIFTQALGFPFAFHVLDLKKARGLQPHTTGFKSYYDFKVDSSTQMVTFTEYMMVPIENQFVVGKMQLRLPIGDLAKGDLRNAEFENDFSNPLPLEKAIDFLGQWKYEKFDHLRAGGRS